VHAYPALLVDVTIFVLSLWVGFEVISKVPATLHTPLMSAANSIHGIVLAGAMLIALTAHNAVGYVIAFLATAFAAMNVVGGYVVTGRMLKMFRRRPVLPTPGSPAVTAGANGQGISGPGSSGLGGTAPGTSGPGSTAPGTSGPGSTAPGAKGQSA
jgi:NAD(P) transhydrogenase subunit alpha